MHLFLFTQMGLFLPPFFKYEAAGVFQAAQDFGKLAQPQSKSWQHKSKPRQKITKQRVKAKVPTSSSFKPLLKDSEKTPAQPHAPKITPLSAQHDPPLNFRASAAVRATSGLPSLAIPSSSSDISDLETKHFLLPLAIPGTNRPLFFFLFSQDHSASSSYRSQWQEKQGKVSLAWYLLASNKPATS
jgi:hypothetical protein